MRRWNRKCGNYGQMGNLDNSKNNHTSNDYSFNSTTALQGRIQGHAQWIQHSWMLVGMDIFCTVMFNNLPGKRDTQVIQMHQGVTTLYGRLAKAMVRKRRSPKSAGYFPIAIFSPDLPVPKSRNGQKSTIADVSINDGLHSHGIVLANRWGRVQVPLDEYFEENREQYLTGKIRNVDVRRITHDPGYVAEYALKGLIRRTASDDDVLVLDWGGPYLRPNRFSKLARQFPEAVAFLKQAKLLHRIGTTCNDVRADLLGYVARNRGFQTRR
jgi:hypothetical protein